MNMSCLILIRKCLVGIGISVFSLAIPTMAASALSTSAVYLVGKYGYLQKLNGNLDVVAEGRVPNLARARGVRDADISPEGDRLFLAVSSNNPLVVVRAADLTVDENVSIEFPPTHAPWEGMYFPHSIMAVSPRYLYMTDEAYSTAPTPFSTVQIDLNANTTTPIFGYSLTSKMQTQVSPDRRWMALYTMGGLCIIDIPTGKTVNLINKEIVGIDNWVMWFNVDWDDNVIEFYIIPMKGGEKNVEKLYVGAKSRRIINRVKLESKTRFGFNDEISYRRILTTGSSKIYVQDGHGNVQVFDRKTGELLQTLDHTLFGETQGATVLPHVSPDERVVFCQKDSVRQDSVGRGSDVSSLCAIDAETWLTVATIEFPQKIVAVLFSN